MAHAYLLYQLTLAGLTVLDYFEQRADAKATVASYPLGGKEGNELATKIFGTMTPTLGQLQIFNLTEYAVLFLPLWLGNLFTAGHNGALGGFALGVAAGMPIGSYLAVRAWRKWRKAQAA